MTLLTMRQEYDEIRSSWRTRPPAEHRFDLERLRELRDAAVDSAEDGTEQLLVELEDLIAQISHTSQPAQRDRQTAYHEPSDAM